jgi:hypothetical protein
MRLLQVDEKGEFSLADDLIDNIPPYAILSHTWGEDHDEVNFKDLTTSPWKTKARYKKLRFCAGQAARDGLKHYWVDTCYIDKSSSAELSEAINSMFYLYHNAIKCYVCLSNVSVGRSLKSEPSFSGYGDSNIAITDGLLGAGRSKSFLLRHLSNSFPRRANDLGVEFHSCKRFTTLQGFLFKLFREALYLSSASMSECHGQRAVKQSAKRTRHALC